MTTVIRKTGGFLMTILVGAMLCSVGARASTVLFSTLGPNNEYDGTNGWLVNGSNYNNQVMAMPFTLSAGATVGDAVLALGNFAGSDSPVNVYIESDNGGQPGSIITTLSQVGDIASWFNGSSGGLVTFTCGLPCTLGAGSYWLVALESDAGTNQAWDFAYQDASGNNAYNFSGSSTGPWYTATQTLSGFRIDAGSSVPEPNSLVLFGSGLLGVAALVRRRLKS
jgi:hypothetical protein